MAQQQKLSDIQKQLKNNGFESRNGKGSHQVWRNGGVVVSVPAGSRIVPPGIVRQIDNAIKATKTPTTSTKN